MKKAIKAVKNIRNSRDSFWREISMPLLALAVILIFCLWNERRISGQTRRWLEQIETVEILAGQDNFSGAAEILSASYQDWLQSRTYLHIVSHHDAVDNAEELYRRCLCLARQNDSAAFFTELTSLRGQLEDLSETERLSLGNIL